MSLLSITTNLTSQSTTVVSSLQVANVLQSKNLSEVMTPALPGKAIAEKAESWSRPDTVDTVSMSSLYCLGQLPSVSIKLHENFWCFILYGHLTRVIPSAIWCKHLVRGSKRRMLFLSQAAASTFPSPLNSMLKMPPGEPTRTCSLLNLPSPWNNIWSMLEPLLADTL